MLATVIFAFIAASLATISSTTSHHMFQNYRHNVLKTNVLVSMRSIQHNISVATRIDSPALGASGNQLLFAVNVDQNSGCYPIAPAPAPRPAWHFYCLANDPVDPAIRNLYHHTGTLPVGTPCGSAAPSIWGGPAVLNCGNSGGTITLLMQFADTTNPFFTRSGVSDDAVRVRLHSKWDAALRGFSRNQRDVDFSLDTVFKVNRAR